MKHPKDHKTFFIFKVTPKKEEEEPAFAGFKLKKASQVKRKFDEPEMEKVELKHHEFEKLPQEEEAEKATTVILSEPIEDKEVDLKKRKKKKKVRL